LALLVCAGLLVLAGCAQVGGDGSTQQNTSDYTPIQGMSAQQRLRQAINLLEQGNGSTARAELQLLLKQQPSHHLAADLLQQIDTPIEDYFPTNFREIVLSPGQSLSTISKIYLGSAYKFHALARFNGIAEPRKLGAGRTIRIPLTSEALAAFEAQAQPEAELPPEPEPETNPDAITPVEKPVEETPITADELENMYRQALNAYRAQDLSKAIELWGQVLSIDPDYENASIYRSQAIQLQNKLRDLK